MSIASRIEEIETHIGDVYDTINYSCDTTGINKNIINIPKYLKKGYIDIINNGTDNLYSNFPKVSGIGSNLSLTPTYEAPMKLNEIQGDTLQDNSPTPDTPVEIQSVTGLQNVNVCGKNLFSSEMELGSIVNSTGQPNNTNDAIRTKYFIPIKPNTTYTISNDKNYYCYSYEYDKDFNFVARHGSQTADYKGKSTITTSDTAKYLKVRTVEGLVENDLTTKWQLEYGNQATTYEPYKGNTYEVNLGKNLFKTPVDVITGAGTGITATYNDDGSITFNGTSTGGVTAFRSRIIISNAHTLSYTSNQTSSNVYLRTRAYSDNIEDFSAIQDSITLTATSNSITSNKSIGCVEIDIANGTTLNNFTIYPQLELGEIATSFSPYFTPIELNKIGDYKDSIKKSSGKNLVYGIEQGNFNYLTGALVENANKVRTKKIPVKPNTTYTISSKLALGESTTYYYEQDGTTGIAGSLLISTTTVKSISFTTPNNAYYVMISLGYSTVPYNASDDNNIMLNDGSTALPYEPYGKVWYIEKNEIKYNVDTTQLTLKSNYTNIEYAEIPKPSNYAGYNSYDHTEIKYTNANWIEMSAGGWDLSNNIGKISGNADKLKWWVGFTKGTGLDAIKTALTGSYIVYPLATPTYEVITNTELINQLESLNNAKSEDGTTNIVVTSEDLSMILNVSALKNEE